MKRWLLVFLAACNSGTHSVPVETAAPQESSESVELALPTPSGSATSPQADTPKPPDFTKTLAVYETRYQAGGNRGSNIERAASFFKDGIVLQPGDVLSFNTMVGPRNESNGFKRAPVIVGGELTEGDGGGTCQVSSTLHAAARFAGGFEFVERTPHSRPSSYILPGLDATVVWPDVDLKLKNSRDLPVKIAISTSDTSSKLVRVLHVEILGGEEALPKPLYTYGVEATSQTFKHRMKVRGEGSESKKTQSGVDGRIIHSMLSVKDGKPVKWESRYPPTDEIWEVGRDWPKDSNPWDSHGG